MISTQLQTWARLLSFVAGEKFSYQHGNENGHVQLTGKADENGHGSGQVGNGRHVAKTHGSQGNKRKIKIVAELGLTLAGESNAGAAGAVQEDMDGISDAQQYCAKHAEQQVAID